MKIKVEADLQEVKEGRITKLKCGNDIFVLPNPINTSYDSKGRVVAVNGNYKIYENILLKVEDVIRSYWQELEEVLLKEDIPLNYRVYIKNYFLSIELRREEDRDDNAN